MKAVSCVIKRRGYIKLSAVSLGILLVGTLVLKRADLAVQGVSRGVDICLHTVIPSLFMFMVIAEFLSLSDLSEVLFSPVFRRNIMPSVPPFHIPESGVPSGTT